LKQTAAFIGFRRSDLAIETSDKEVLFQMRHGALLVEAKFNPHEMLYHDQLAL
jgi:hypothetical protein